MRKDLVKPTFAERVEIRRLAWLWLTALLVLLAGAPAALAVPGGPGPENDVDQGVLLRDLIAAGGQIPHPSSGNFGVLNASGANAERDIQINDPSLDGFQTFPGAPPFVFATESETSTAAAGQNIVVGYNSSAGGRVSDAAGDISQILFSGYSVSHDGGHTWHSGFVPAAPDSYFGLAPITAGDPALGVDRQGNFYYVGINNPGIQINKSTDGGRTWSAATIAQDVLSDKPWLAIGPDPAQPSRDDLYVTWTRLGDPGWQLLMSRSTDGGTTWSTPQVLYAPVATAQMSAQATFSSPVVDPSSGRLYVPFLHFSNTDADDVKVLVSDDGGVTFHFLKFNASGAPDANSFPNVTPGSATDCTISGVRLTIHQGTSTAGNDGLPRWVQATRIISQPMAAADHGRLFIALNSSTDPVYGAGTGSEVRLLYSPDGGATWAAPTIVAPATASEPQHFHPAITVDPTGSQVRVAYYVQGASGRIGVDSAVGTVGPAGVSFGRPSHVASPFDLPPTNITVSSTTTLNYDAWPPPCYGLGEYLSATQTSTGAVAAWGGDRQLFKEPPGALISGVHPQEDVFFSPLR